MSTLYQITEDLQALDDLLVELGGDLSDPRVEAAITAWAEQLDSDLTGKADNYAALIREIEARALVREEEAKRLADRATVDRNVAIRLRDALKEAFQARRIKVMETARFKISVARNGGKAPLVIENPSLIPLSYQSEIPARLELNRELIRETLESGKAVPGCKLGERGTHLRMS